MADVKWIKITTDIFDDEKMLLIESLPDSNAIIVVWFKLLCLAGKMNNSGVFMMNDRIAYTDKMLSTIFRMNEATVKLALQTSEQFGMVELIDGVITIPNWGKHQSLEQLEARREYQKEYHREYRKRQKEIADHKHLRKHLRNDDVNSLEEEGEEEKKKKENKKKEIDYDFIVHKFNTLCVSLPKVTILSDKRKKAMNKVFCKESVISIDYLDELLLKVEASDFLTGRTGNWKANFDWVMNPTNIAKVIDGNYDNRSGNTKKISNKNSTAQQLDEFYNMAAEWAEGGE